MPVLLVTGFEAFGDHPANPTADGVRALARDPAFESRVAFAILPVTFAGAPAVLRARMRRERVIACVMFGLAAGERDVRVEYAAYSEGDPSLVDNSGLVRKAVEQPHGPVRVVAGALVEIAEEALRRVSAPVRISGDPGRYVCNATYYAALQANAPRSSSAVFVHVPATRSIGGEFEDDVVQRWMRAVVAGVLADVEATVDPPLRAIDGVPLSGSNTGT